MGWFKRSRPAPAPALMVAPEDITIAHAWGLTLEQWNGMDDGVRRYCRENVTQADRAEVTA